jgi:antitoxin component of MazEF toxin-antitoxin module
MIAELRAKAQVTVPREVVLELGLNEGDKFEVTVKNGVIKMIPVAVYPKNYVERLEAQVREAQALIESGDLKSYSSADELIAALHAGDGTDK